MLDSRPVCSALAAALKQYFSGSETRLPDRSKAKDDSMERIEIHLPNRVVTLEISPTCLAEISNPLGLETGHRYKDDAELSMVLIDLMQQKNVLELITAARSGEVIRWMSESVSYK